MMKGVVVGACVALLVAVAGCSSEPAAGDGEEVGAAQDGLTTYHGHCQVVNGLTNGKCRSPSLPCTGYNTPTYCPVGAAGITVYPAACGVYIDDARPCQF